jgi:hypothetical protein
MFFWSILVVLAKHKKTILEWSLAQNNKYFLVGLGHVQAWSNKDYFWSCVVIE